MNVIPQPGETSFQLGSRLIEALEMAVVPTPAVRILVVYEQSYGISPDGLQWRDVHATEDLVHAASRKGLTPCLYVHPNKWFKACGGDPVVMTDRLIAACDQVLVKGFYFDGAPPSMYDEGLLRPEHEVAGFLWNLRHSLPFDPYLMMHLSRKANLPGYIDQADFVRFGEGGEFYEQDIEPWHPQVATAIGECVRAGAVPCPKLASKRTQALAAAGKTQERYDLIAKWVKWHCLTCSIWGWLTRSDGTPLPSGHGPPSDWHALARDTRAEWGL